MVRFTARAFVMLIALNALCSCRTGKSKHEVTYPIRPVLSPIGLRPEKVKKLTIGYGKELYVVRDPKEIVGIYDSVEHHGLQSTECMEDGVLAFTTTDSKVAVIGFVFPEVSFPTDVPKFKPYNRWKTLLGQMRSGHLYDKVATIPQFQTRSARVLEDGRVRAVRRSRLRKVQHDARKLTMIWSPDSPIGCTANEGDFLRSPDTKSMIILDLARPIAFSVFIATIPDYKFDPAPGSPTWAGVYKELVYTKIAIIREEWYVSLAFYSPTQAKWYLNGSIGGYSAEERDPVQEGYTRMYDQMLADSR